jgi:protein-S-isoprenylcysteine O-methyltransferase Ste14
VVTPLVFRPGAAEVAIAVWAVFEFVMRVRQHLLSRGPGAVDRSPFVLLPCLVAVAALGGAGLAVRIHAEERQLTDSPGEEYEQFAAGRKRLVPGVW